MFQLYQKPVTKLEHMNMMYDCNGVDVFLSGRIAKINQYTINFQNVLQLTHSSYCDEARNSISKQIFFQNTSTPLQYIIFISMALYSARAVW